MRNIILSLLAIVFFSSCNNDDNKEININEKNFLIFGHFYGMCGGEQCVETFKLTNKALFEDTIDDYNGQNMNFIELGNDKFEEVKDLTNFFPNELLTQTDTVFGCPDCADGGGLLIQYSENGTIKTWRIDQSKTNVPNYLHNFIDKVNEKIQLINN